MKRKKRRAKNTGHRTQFSSVRPTWESPILRMPEFSRPSQVIERSSPAKAGELDERYRYTLAEVKRSVITGGQYSRYSSPCIY